MNTRMAMDSGAFSLFNKYAKKGAIEHSDFSYYSSDKFITYLDKYCAWIRDHHQHLDYYVTLDVIFNPEMSWEIFKDMQDRGLKPMPVIHFGESMDWVHKYMKETEYLGIGGVGTRQGTMDQYFAWCDQVFEILCPGFRNAEGKLKQKPSHKTHGFALTQYDVLYRYPWHSVDSTTCWRAASNGSFILPQFRNNEAFGQLLPDFTGRPYWFPCTVGRAAAASNIHRAGDIYQQLAREYLETLGFKLEDAAENYILRNVVSFWYFYQLSQYLTELRDYPFRMYISGRPAGTGGKQVGELLRKIKSLGTVELNYLGTMADTKTFDLFYNYMKELNEDQDAAPSTQGGKPSPAPSGLRARVNPLLLRRRPRIRV